MQPLKLDLMSREAFADLGLHERNGYLQKLASEFAEKTGRPTIALGQDALARLRRFYLRRSFADLERGKVDLKISDPELAAALRSLGETIKDSERQDDVVGALKSELPGPILRKAPTDDHQLSLFVPVIYDAPLKDDVNLMDIAPFTMSKNRRTTGLRYELNDCIVTVDGSAEHGLATVFDYDIFLHMVTYLAEEARRYHIDISKGLRPNLPPQVYRPKASHILKFCRRGSGGLQYKSLEAALDRLSGTRLKVANLRGGRRREVVNVPLIDKYRVVSATSNGHVDDIEIYIPSWVYESVVREKGKPQILTLNPDYFLISQGLGRMVYRLARRAAGRTEARYSIIEVHKRSGSPQALPQFAQILRKLVAHSKMFPLPDYDLDLIAGQSGELLWMRYRGEGAKLGKAKAPLPLLA
ncbi:Replication initiator protein A [Bradyrhizobium sp. YR681]|uniref:replication initiator protein A n=1 Tax=Bradyrhizobium sp. YR681 TaxID=1144344 RepID=UPI000270EE10|nr:replication initiator protein A [Bradyrhizobium sp. YR681]EJN16272.1 Replication initiator protein A [Bradyrhizobium sp. YR681]